MSTNSKTHAKQNPIVQIKPLIHKLKQQNQPQPQTQINDEVRNTVTRLPLHRRLWLNDPDCLILREATSLTAHEVKAVATIAGLLGGPTIVSDDLPALTPDRTSCNKSVILFVVSLSSFRSLGLVV